ncbi:MAG: amidohydrolase [Cellvibrionaceae bacterium]
MKPMLLTATLLLCSLILNGCSSDHKATVFSAKSIITMNPTQARAQAVAVVEGKIHRVGTLAEVKESLAGYDVEEDHRFADKILMPGFIEPHLHPYLAGILLPMEFITPHDWNLPGKQAKGVRGQEAYLSRLQQASNEEDDFLWTWGYHHYYHGELTREILDKISPDKPILVWHRSFHEIIVNSAAIEELGVSNTEHPQVNWEKGHFYENGLKLLLPNIMPKLTRPWRYLPALTHGRDIVHAGGITTVSDGAFGTIDFDTEWTALRFSSWNRDSSPFNFVVLADGKGLGAAMGYEPARDFINKLPEKNTDKVSFLPKQVKLFADGAAYSQLMQMSEGYLDGHHGEWLMTPEQLEKAARVFWMDDYQLHIHVNGDLGLDKTLDIIERLQSEYPRQDHRSTIHHLAYARTDQATRMAELGVRVSANPYYVWALADKYSEVGLGPERAQHMVPLQSLVDAGVPISLHSDFTMAPVEPLLLAWAAATRLTADGNLAAAEERIDLDTALRAITLSAAEQLQMESSIGSIEEGKQADFVVLEADPYAIPIEQLKDIAIWGTVLNGKVQPIIDLN